MRLIPFSCRSLSAAAIHISQFIRAATYKAKRLVCSGSFFVIRVIEMLLQRSRKMAHIKPVSKISAINQGERKKSHFFPHNKSNGVRLIFSKSQCYSCCKNVIKLDGGAK